MGRVNSPIPVREVVASDDTYKRGYHKGNLGGLDAVDTDLAVGNIKKDVNVFGKVGTFENTLAEDVIETAKSALIQNEAGTIKVNKFTIDGETEQDLVSLTQTYADPSITVASAVLLHQQSVTNFTFRLYMDGVMVSESANLVLWMPEMLIGTRAMVGADKICKASIYNVDESGGFCYIYAEQGGTLRVNCFILAGSVKI